MLNITSSISLSLASQDLVQALIRSQNGNLSQGSWTLIQSSVKNEISGKLLSNQRLKCVYCERYLVGLGHEIDHFAHKGTYSEFSFVPENLFYSCKLCNSSGRKGQKNTIQIHNPTYSQCTFLIIHPYYDNPNIEIIFSDSDRIDFDMTKCSEKGKATIKFFGMDDLIYTNIRSRALVYERLNPLTTVEEELLIQESISYKK